ncbi:MAG: peptide-binding protein [Tumebacillaceae bacterium]
MKNKKVVVFSSLAAALTASLVLAGCSNSSAPSDNGKNAAADNKVDGGDIIYGSIGEPTTFNPFWSNDQSSMDINGVVFDTLYNMTNKITPYPMLADGQPQISADGKVWTIKLHKDVKFSDGQPLTADDVVFTFSIPISKDYNGPRKSDFEQLEKVEKVDDLTVKFTLKDKYAPFMANNLTSYGILPKHILGNVAIKDMEKADFNKKPIGSGPFKVTDWQAGQFVKLERNETYFQKKPSVSTITYKIVPDQNALIAQLQSGEVNMTDIAASNVKTVKNLVQTGGKLQMFESPDLAYVYIGWNNKNPLFADKKVRQALTMALDRQSIVDNILDGNAKVANAPESELSYAYDQSIKGLPYDMEKAKQQLADAGWKPGPDGILQKDGKKFSFELMTNQGNKAREQIATYTQQQFKKLGIEVKPKIVEWSAFINQYITQGKYDAAVESWGTGTDPDLTAIFSSSSIGTALNYNYYSNPEVDKLNTENTKELDQNKRADIIKKAEALIADDQTYTFLYYPMKHMAAPANLKGVDFGPIQDLYNVQDWYFTK